MNGFPSLETEAFVAYIADNAALGIHRAGYNGVASLVPRHSGNNLFVPTYAGLNYETISLTGLSPYAHPGGSKFEPRCETMHIEESTGTRVVLAQPETSHAHVSARISFSVEEPHYLHQRIELTFHQRFCKPGEPHTFHSLWASYIHQPPDRHIYLKADPETPALQDWTGITKVDHGATNLQVRPLPDDRALKAGEHLEIMESTPPLSDQRVGDAEWPPMSLSHRFDGPLRFYYGLCHGEQLFLMMFRQPERFRLAYSPCGGGTQPAWNPAWDYVLFLENAEIGRPYVWELCLAVKRYESRVDILNEVDRYLQDSE